MTLPGDDKPGPINIGDEDLSHLSNWFECLRSRNTQTNATVDNGFLHSVACIMAAQSYWQGKRMYYDANAQRSPIRPRRRKCADTERHASPPGARDQPASATP